MSGSSARGRKPGRPSVRRERRDQIVTAFVELVQERGHHEVSIAEVATRAGVHRSAVRHFVGNRSDLVIAALDHVDALFEAHFDAAVGAEASVDQILDYVFGTVNLADQPQLGDAVLILANAAVTDRTVRDHLRVSYEDEVREVAAMLEDPPGEQAIAIAYQVICLAEHNWTLQQVGLDASYAEHARSLAARIIAEFVERSGE